MVDGNPQAEAERRACGRHLLQHPLTCAEQHPDIFRLIRRHEASLDQWFTQRLGYRLHLDADTARLYKVGYVPSSRPLRTKTERPFNRLEYVLLALVLASTAAGPAVISLRDLVAEVRSAAAEAGIVLTNDVTERRALVTVLRWMIDHGLATELHEHIDSYLADEVADAVLRIRPDRVALLPVPALVGASTADVLMERVEQRSNTRQWMRRRLVEDPVVYRDDLEEAEWAELRRRIGDERQNLDEMFGLVLEVRAEGLAAIDPAGKLADQRFPTVGTLSHAALVLIERLGDQPASEETVIGHVCELITVHGRIWSNEWTASPERLARGVITLLSDLRLAEIIAQPSGAVIAQPAGSWSVRLLPAAARFVAIEQVPPAGSAVGSSAGDQDSLW